MSNDGTVRFDEYMKDVQEGAYDKNPLTEALTELRDRIPESQKVADEALSKVKKLHG